MRQLMQQVKENTIYEIDRVDVRVLPDPLFYTEHNKPAIAENWRKAVAANSRLFDGEIYLAPEAHLDDRVFKSEFQTYQFCNADVLAR
jgi:hypothetical protein